MSSPFREVKFPGPTPVKPTGKVCPSCGGNLGWGTIPCPEGKLGCLVAHMGYVCSKCGKRFTG